MPLKLPVDENTLCLFAAFLSESCASSTLQVAISAIRSKHIDLGLRCNTADMLTLKRVIEGVNRSRASVPKLTRRPITTSTLTNLASVLRPQQWEDRVFFAVACIATYGLLRMAEIFHSEPYDHPGLLVSDLAIVSHSHFKLSLRRSKTDQCGHGMVVDFFANNSPSCPCRAFLVGYWPHIKFKLQPTSPLFCLDSGAPYTRQAFVSKLREVVQLLGWKPEEFSGHSFRRGGATSLAESGVADSTIKTMGRWKSVAYQVYIDTSEDSKRQASVAMANAGIPNSNTINNNTKGFWGQPRHRH